MLGLIVIYFIGKYFFDLAKEYDKNKWGYAVLGVASYYAGAFVGGIILAILDEIFRFGLFEISDTVLGLLALPFGLLACWGAYKILENNFKNTPNSVPDSDILDDEFME